MAAACSDRIVRHLLCASNQYTNNADSRSLLAGNFSPSSLCGEAMLHHKYDLSRERLGI